MAKKRGHGEGTIYQTADGRWRAALDLGIVAGKHKRKYLSAATRREVAEKLSRALADHRAGTLVTDETQTVGQYLAHWLETSVKPSVRLSTYLGYRCNVAAHLVPMQGHIRLARYTPQHAQALVSGLLAKGLAPSTVQRIRAVMTRALGQAARFGLIARNPMPLADSVKVERRQADPFTPDEVRIVLGAARGDRFEALYYVAFGTGLRQSEILALRWDRLDLDAGTAHITHALQRLSGARDLVPPKGASARRTIALPAVVVEKLRERRTAQMRDRLAAGDAWEDAAGIVFTDHRGRPLVGDSVRQRFQRLLATAGVRRRRFHETRHTCATFLIAQGEHPRVIMEQLGHSNISITMNTYAHIMPAAQAAAAARMDAILTGKPEAGSATG